MQAPETKRWIRVRVGCGAEEAEDLAGLLATLGALGAEIDAAGITAYFEDDAGAGEVRARLDALPGAGVAGRSVRIDWIEAEPWHEAWRAYFRPQTVGGRLWVGAPWHPAPEDEEVETIRINPGAAFGTGTHETTRLCLAHLAASPPRGARVLDIGTGSGILAIAARKLGAAEVLAVDPDPIAIESAGENAALNDLAGALDLRVATAEEVPGAFDLVLANLIEGTLLAARVSIVARVAPGGTLVLSGLLVHQADAVARAYGLEVVETRSMGEWAAVVLRRP